VMQGVRARLAEMVPMVKTLAGQVIGG